MSPANPPGPSNKPQTGSGSSAMPTNRIGRSSSVGNSKASPGSSLTKPKPTPEHKTTEPRTSAVDLSTYAANQDPGDKSPIDLATYAANQNKAETPDSTASGTKPEEVKSPASETAHNATPRTVRVMELQDDDETGNGKPLVSVKLNLYQTLAQLRRQLRGKIVKLHAFCYSNGAEVDRENVSLAAYLAAASAEQDEPLPEQNAEAKTQPKTNTVELVYVKRREAGEQGERYQAPELDPLDLGERLEKPSQEADKFEGGDREFADHGAPEEGLGEGVKHAGQLTAEEWEDVLENCGALCGWYVDRQNNKIVQAPMPAFRLRRSKVDAADATAKGDVSTTALESSGAIVPVGSAQSQDLTKAVATTASDSTTTPSIKTPDSTLGESSKDVVKMRPRFHVNDNSKIEIIVTSHEFETSMATNDFSAQSTEASVSGGFGGFGASVSAGYASSESSTSKQTNNKYEKTMVAKYLYPRATLYLEPSDLEVSPELATALAKLAKSPNVAAMRKLHQDFGQLFCRRVTIGGRLLTTKTMSEDKKVSEQSQKQEYKVSVAAAVTTPYVSASVKHEQSKGSETSNNTATSDKRENHAFEAVGGDTILASNPLAWAPTCGPHTNWRVIDRIGLTPMADAISEVPGYSSVKADFARAIPVLAKYIETAQTREVKVRLCVTRPSARMSLSYAQSEAAADRNDIPNISYYLGHAPDYSITPKWYQIKDPVNDFWGVTEATAGTSGGQVPLFGPQSYRAPAIYGYAGNRIGKTYYGSMDSQDAVNTIWSVSTPFDECLSHQCRVMLRTVPKAQAAPVDATGPPPPAASSLAVFRNQQGVFLPAMTDDEHGHIFRIIKRGAAAFGETIKESDEVRLCWMMKDQTTGFRDFTEDAFGRRRTTMPPDVSDAPFWFKLPWPRFESLSKPEKGANPVPNTLVMSQVPSEDPTATDLCILPAIRQYRRKNATIPYGVEDVAFRIDTVSNEGRGDARDYMLWGLKQSKDTDEDTGVAAPVVKRPATVDPRLALLAAFFYLDDPEKVPYILRNEANYEKAEAAAPAPTKAAA